MTVDDVIKLVGLPLFGVVVGAWLTNFFFPFRLKRREWRWGKELLAREQLFETISRISFIAEHYFKGEYNDRFSMSGMGLHEADKEIMRLVKELHLAGHKLKVYLSKDHVRIFEKYLRDSQNEYDIAKESWGQWDNDDHLAEDQHTENTISGQAKAAAKALAKIKLSS
jgi:arginyl-tRNA--protein-N-Asp/Glu arginylyltransferase